MSEEVSIVRTDEIDTRPVMYAKSDVSIVVRSSRGFVYTAPRRHSNRLVNPWDFF